MNPKEDITLPKYASLNESDNNEKWMCDGEILVNSLNIINSLPHTELMNYYIQDGSIQHFLTSYLDKACCSYHTLLCNDDYLEHFKLEKQIYRLVFEILIKLFQVSNCYVSKSDDDKHQIPISIVYSIDIIMLVNICCLYFHSPLMCQLLNEYLNIYKSYMESTMSDYCNAFQKIFQFKINNGEKNNVNLYLNEFIHTSLCMVKVIPQFYKQVVNETNIVKLMEIISNPDELNITCDEHKSLSDRLTHLIFLHITLLRRFYDEPCKKLILIFNCIEYIPNIFSPLLNIYKFEQYINEHFKDILPASDYTNIITCIENFRNDYQFVQNNHHNDLSDTNSDCQNNRNVFHRNSRQHNQTIGTVNEYTTKHTINNNHEQTVLLSEIFPLLSQSIVSDSFTYCDSDILKTVDFIISQKNNEDHIREILSSVEIDECYNQQRKIKPSLAFSLPFESTNFDITLTKDKDESTKDITLQLVQQQNDERDKNMNKINQLVQKYMISHGMAATLLHLDIDQYQDEYDDDDDTLDNNNHFQYIINKFNNPIGSNNDLPSSSLSSVSSTQFASFASSETGNNYDKVDGFGANVTPHNIRSIEHSTSYIESNTSHNLTSENSRNKNISRTSSDTHKTSNIKNKIKKNDNNFRGRRH